MTTKIYGRTSLTGGVVGALDAIDGAKLNDGDASLIFHSSGQLYAHRLDAISGASESSPAVIAPDSNPGNKRHLQLGFAMLKGNWTPGLAFNGSATGITYATDYPAGYWTRKGDEYTVTGAIVLTSKGSFNANDVAKITGLPAACANANAAYSAVTLRLTNITFADHYQGYVEKGVSTIALEEITKAGVMTPLTYSDFANNSVIVLSATYRIA
jgi:hypothetical protein